MYHDIRAACYYLAANRDECGHHVNASADSEPRPQLLIEANAPYSEMKAKHKANQSIPSVLTMWVSLANAKVHG